MDKENTKQMPNGWRDVKITEEMPLGYFVALFNILNQRLVNLEDLVTIKDKEGKEVSLSEVYAAEAKAQMEAEMKKAAEKKEEK